MGQALRQHRPTTGSAARLPERLPEAKLALLLERAVQTAIQSKQSRLRPEQREDLLICLTTPVNQAVSLEDEPQSIDGQGDVKIFLREPND